MSDGPETEAALGQEWWLAVQRIADLVTRDGVAPAAPESEFVIRKELMEQGFSKEGIVQAMAWMDMASMSGNLMDALGMLQPVSPGVRVDHAIEKASIHPKLIRAVDCCRRRAWIGHDVAERLLEGLRGMDTRDWDQMEIEAFLAQVLGVSAPALAGASLDVILGSGKTEDQYN